MYWDQVSIPLELLRGRYDIYHATCERSLPRWSPCPTIYTWHSATALSYQSLIKKGKVRAELLPGVTPKRSSFSVPKFHNFYYATMPHWAKKIITVSHFSRQEIIELAHVTPKKIVSIPLAASPEFSNTARRDDDCLAKFGLSGSSLYVLYVGALST